MMGDYSTFETRLDVRPDDIDMNRHVHNAKYHDYVLAARIDQMERCYGMSMDEFFARGFSWVVKSSFIEHQRPLNMGDSIVVRTRVSEIRSRGIRVEFEILRKPEEKLSASGWYQYLMVNVDTGRPAVIPEDIVAKYSV